MNRIFSLSIILSLFITLSCVEENNLINLKPEVVDTTLFDTTYISSVNIVPDQKKVLIQDFTGVRCPNCPEGAIKIHELDSTYPDRIVAMACHFNNPFGTPHILSIDYRTAEALEIYNFLGKGGLPCGGIDMMKFSSETNVLVGISKWPSYAAERLSVLPPVNLNLSSIEKPSGSNIYIIRVQASFSIANSEINYLTLGITESEMISPQSFPAGKVDTFYTHNHVLRKLLTIPTGQLLFNSPEKDRVIIKEFKITIPSGWNPNNCDIIAYVHKSGLSYDVLQSETIPLK